MNHIQKLQTYLQTYSPYDDIENGECRSFSQFLEAFGLQAYSRNNLIGHMSASGWIVNKDRTKALMIHHNIFKTWSWVGGHADDDTDLLHVAIKEAEEETSLAQVTPLSPYPIDFNIMVVHNHNKHGQFIPRHLHYNVVYAFEADETLPLKIKADENSGVRWINNEDVAKFCANDHVFPYYERIMQKIKKIS